MESDNRVTSYILVVIRERHPLQFISGRRLSSPSVELSFEALARGRTRMMGGMGRFSRIIAMIGEVRRKDAKKKAPIVM